MRDSLTSTFRKSNVYYGASVVDVVQLGGGVLPDAALTPGATIIDTIRPGGPAVSQRWSVVSISVQGSLVFFAEQRASVYGRLGDVQGGFILEAPHETSGNQRRGPLGEIFTDPWTPTMEPLPKDNTLVVDLWDPANDPMPPTIYASIQTAPPGLLGASQCLPISATLLPPMPIPLNAGVTPSVGIWILPSIIGDNQVQASGLYGLAIINATYTMNYDDGR